MTSSRVAAGGSGRTRRAILAGAPAGLLAAGVLGACGNSAQPAALPPAGTPSGSIDFTSWSGLAGWEETARLFGARYPGVRMNPIVAPDESQGTYSAMLLSMSAAGTPPDAVWVNNDQVAYFVTQGLIQVLEPYIARDRREMDIYHPVALRVYQLQGKQAAMPGNMNPVGVYVNRTLFEQAGVPLPPRNHKDPGWTHDTLLDAARRLTRTDGGAPQFGFAVDGWIGRWFPFLWGNGGDAFDNPSDPKRFTFVSRETEATLQWLADLRFKHRVAPTPADLQGTTVTSLFQQGRVGVLVDLCGSMNGIDRVSGLQWDAVPVSRGPAGRFTRLAGAGMGLHPGSKNKETAWTFLKYYTGPESPTLVRDRVSNIPALKEGISAPKLMDWVSPEVKRMWMETQDYGRVQAHHLKWTEVMEGDGARKLYGEALDGKRAVKDALELIKQHADAVLK